MRLLSIILIISLTACTMVASQQPSEEAKKEAEFHELLKKANAAQEVNRTSIKAADHNSQKIITKTVTNIVSLKNEVKQLKTELNETNQKLDSINSNTGIKFRFSAISNNEENR
jgi:septal ring factor EnvC (AmiA/AmiB activator)